MEAYRVELKNRVEKGTELVRRVKFAECDYSNKDLEKFLIEKEKIMYPNIVMYALGYPTAFNLNPEELKTVEEQVNWLKEQFLT
jgi:hypothetical protein